MRSLLLFCLFLCFMFANEPIFNSNFKKEHSNETGSSPNKGFEASNNKPETNKTKNVGTKKTTKNIQNNEDFFKKIKTKRLNSDPNIVWQQFGPGMSGNNKSAYWHPTDPNVLYIGPNMGNSYVSFDKGQTYQTFFDEDGTGYKAGDRGPADAVSYDFSRQNPDYGFCSSEDNNGLFLTTDKGRSWQRHKVSRSTFGKSFLACITVNPKNDNIWYVGAGKMRDLGHADFPKKTPHGTGIDVNSQGKIWKSTDKGQTWSLQNKGFHAKGEVETIMTDPVNANTIYVTSNYGFYKSVDGGNHWVQKTNGLDHDVMRSFTLHHDKKTNAVTLFMIVNTTWKLNGNSVQKASGGVYKSTDRGETWKCINGNLAVNMKVLGTDRSTKNGYLNNIAGYFDLSKTEANKYQELPTSFLPRFNGITIDPTDANNIYVVNEFPTPTGIGSRAGEIWRSEDGGKNWYVIFRFGYNWNKGKHIDYWKKRGNPVGRNVSLQYLKHWLDRDAYTRKFCNFVRFNCDGSVLHTQLAKISLFSYDKGKTWLDIDDIETSPGSKNYVAAGNSNVPGDGLYQHLAVPNKVFAPGGENSLWITCNDGYKVRPDAQAAKPVKFSPSEQSLSCYLIHPNDTTIHYAMFNRQHDRGKLLCSVDNGKTWETHGVPFPTPWGKKDNKIQVRQLNLMIDEDNPEYMYFNVPKSSKDIEFTGMLHHKLGVFKSADGGRNWQEINTGLPKSLDVVKIAFSPDSPKTLYAAVHNKDGGLYKSTDRGENWKVVSSTIEVANKYGINDIHYSENGKVYITSGYRNAEANEGGLWVSSDNMKSWKRIFDYPWVYKVKTALYDDNTILISTLSNNNINQINPGMYLSKDGGESWIKINKGNGQSDRVNDIAIDHYNPGKYYCSTRGSGWYVASDEDVKATIKATDLNVQETIDINVGDTRQLKAEILPSNATFSTQFWTSESNKIANINNKGRMIGISVGSTSITVKHIPSGISKKIKVNVKSAK